MFTKLGSVVLWFAIIIGAIVSVVMGVFVGKAADNGLIGFLVVVLGWLVTLISNLALGIVVEISNNTKDTADNSRKSRELLENIAASGFNVSNSKGSLTEKADGENKFWYCPKCGEKNPNSNSFCSVCSANRGGVGLSMNDIWVCKGCGEQNSVLDYTCKKCHRGKN